MATRYYQVPVGGNQRKDVTEAGSSSVGFVELAVVYDATGANRQRVLLALKALRHYLLKDTWPPA